MKERPILFNHEMVRAVLNGKKTQTRRVNGFKQINTNPHKWRFVEFRICLGYEASRGYLWAGFLAEGSTSLIYIKCPLGMVDGRLWVRETFGSQVRSYAGGTGKHIVYKADNPKAIDFEEANGKKHLVKWKPSIHMKREYSRINLEITNIRVERVQEIMEIDARSEGVQWDECNHLDPHGYSAKQRFETLYNSINEKRGCGWDVNPWVWVIEFKQCENT